MQYLRQPLDGANFLVCKHSDGSVLQCWKRKRTSFSQWRRLDEEWRVCEAAP